MMKLLLVAAFVAAAPVAIAQPTQPAQPAAEQSPSAEPEMVCKLEYATGSRVKKVRVCRPLGQKQDEEQLTQLQRQTLKNGDQRVEQGGLVISPGSGIGN